VETTLPSSAQRRCKKHWKSSICSTQSRVRGVCERYGDNFREEEVIAAMFAELPELLLSLESISEKSEK
jgi:hypothetical protein